MALLLSCKSMGVENFRIVPTGSVHTKHMNGFPPYPTGPIRPNFGGQKPKECGVWKPREWDFRISGRLHPPGTQTGNACMTTAMPSIPLPDGRAVAGDPQPFLFGFRSHHSRLVSEYFSLWLNWQKKKGSGLGKSGPPPVFNPFPQCKKIIYFCNNPMF